jgi:outer membrane biosynthesis protein TonB
MLVNPATQALALATRVDAASGSLEAGMARLDVVIGKDGRVVSARAISGDPPLAEAAVGAVRQWTYRPTLSNWEPVEVRSEVAVDFARN